MDPDDKQKLDELHTAIVGKPEMGTPGLVRRVTKLERIVSRLIIGASGLYSGVEAYKFFSGH